MKILDYCVACVANFERVSAGREDASASANKVMSRNCDDCHKNQFPTTKKSPRFFKVLLASLNCLINNREETFKESSQ